MSPISYGITRDKNQISRWRLLSTNSMESSSLALNSTLRYLRCRDTKYEQLSLLYLVKKDIDLNSQQIATI